MARIEYVDFDIQIEHARDGYRVEVDSPVGQTISRFQTPFTDLELENFLLKIGHSRRNDMRRVDIPEVETIKIFGGRMFDALFDAEVRGVLRSSLDEARRQGKGLRIRLGLTNAPELADLPWEYLYIPKLNRFLSLSARTPLVRDLELPEPIRPLKVDAPLRVLVVISSPSDYPPLDVEREWKRLQSALADLEQRGAVKLDRLDMATFAALQHRLRRRAYHIFHFIGHGAFDPHRQDGVLLLEGEDGRSHQVSGQELGMVLHDHETLRLALLNACEGARVARDDPFAGTAQSLIQQRVPAVIAMQFEISDGAAIALAQGFYSALADGYPVDGALADARRAVFAQSGGVEWGTPVLYLRAQDGNLFDLGPLGITQPHAALPPTKAAAAPSEIALPPTKAAALPEALPAPASPADPLLATLLAQPSAPLPTPGTAPVAPAAKAAEAPVRGQSLPSHRQAPSPPPITRSPRLLGALGALALLLVVVLLFTGQRWLRPDSSPLPVQNLALPTLAATIVSTPVPAVQPVAADEYMVLVGGLQPLDDAPPRDPTLDLVATLERQLGTQAIPFSRLRIRQYPAMIASSAAAQAAAQANAATVVVWGSYDAARVNLNVELGPNSRERFGGIPERIGDDVLARTVNVSARVNDVERESIAPQVLAAFNVLHTADGNGFESLRAVAFHQELNDLLKRSQIIPATPVSQGAGTQLSRYLSAYFDDTSTAEAVISQAISRDDGNPLLYIYRAAALRRLTSNAALQGDLQAAQAYAAASRDDISTAQRLGGADWLTPAYLQAFNDLDAQNYAASVAVLDRLVAQQPDNWFPRAFRGAVYFLSGQPELARADLQRSQELNPETTFVDGLTALLAMRAGDLDDARTQMRRITESRISPTFGARLLQAIFGEAGKAYSAMLGALGQLSLGRHSEVIASVNQVLSANPQSPQPASLFLVRGIAECNLNDFAAAEASYSQAIERDPNVGVAYLLRAEVRQQQGNLQGAFEDFGAGQERLAHAGSQLPNLAGLGCKSILAE